MQPCAEAGRSFYYPSDKETQQHVNSRRFSMFACTLQQCVDMLTKLGEWTFQTNANYCIFYFYFPLTAVSLNNTQETLLQIPRSLSFAVYVKNPPKEKQNLLIARAMGRTNFQMCTQCRTPLQKLFCQCKRRHTASQSSLPRTAVCLSPASLQITTDEYVLGALAQTRRATPSTFKLLVTTKTSDKNKIHAVNRAEQRGWIQIDFKLQPSK